MVNLEFSLWIDNLKLIFNLQHETKSTYEVPDNFIFVDFNE